MKSARSIRAGFERDFAQRIVDKAEVEFDSLIGIERLKIAQQTVYCVQAATAEVASKIAQAGAEWHRVERRGTVTVMFWPPLPHEARQ